MLGLFEGKPQIYFKEKVGDFLHHLIE